MGIVGETLDVLDCFGRFVGRFLLPLLVVSPLWLLESGPVQTARFKSAHRITLRGLFYQADNYSGADSSRNSGTASTGSFTREGDTWTVFSVWEAPHGMCSGARHVTRTRSFVADDVRFYSQADTGLCTAPMYAQFGLSVLAAFLFRVGSAEAAAASHARGPVAIRGAMLWLGASAAAASSAGLYAMQYATQIAKGQQEQAAGISATASMGSGGGGSGGGFYGFGPSWWAMVLVSGVIGALCGLRRLIVATSPVPPPPPPPPPPPGVSPGASPGAPLGAPSKAPPAAAELEMACSQAPPPGKGAKGSRKSLLAAPMPASAAEEEDEEAPADSTAIAVAPPQKGRVV